MKIKAEKVPEAPRKVMVAQSSASCQELFQTWVGLRNQRQSQAAKMTVMENLRMETSSAFGTMTDWLTD